GWGGGERGRLAPFASSLGEAGWRWGTGVLDAIGQPERVSSPLAGFNAWRALPEWEDEAPPPKPGSLPVAPQDARAKLQRLVGSNGEARAEQSAYAEEAAYAFGPPERAGAPRMALIEADTGIGTTN